jgi:uncharacterized protein (DUF2164 family)
MNKALGSNPATGRRLNFIGGAPPRQGSTVGSVVNVNKDTKVNPVTRVTTYIKDDYVSMIHGLMYRDHLDFMEVVDQALARFFKGQDLPAAPAAFVDKLKRKGRRRP